MSDIAEDIGATSTGIVTAAILVIGDEILSGRTKDKNIGTIADHLTRIGIRLREVRVVADDEADIISALDALRGRYDYVFTTGGIGPTHDDITADAVAKAFGVSIDVDPRAIAMMLERMSEADLTPARRRMARIPAGADLIDNPVSRAPGFFIGNVVVMAGVPRIMEAMLASATPRLRTGAKLVSLSIRANAPEGLLAPILSGAQADYADVQMGSYPYYEEGHPGAFLVLRSVDEARLEVAGRELEARLDAANIGHERRTQEPA
jgi:molybdenum cofactor synthesis domain-containing protein